MQAYTIDSAAAKTLSPTYLDGRDFWAGRRSTHKASSAGPELYDQFAAGLLRNHSENERDYIESCKEAERLEVIEEGVMEGEREVPSFKASVTDAMRRPRSSTWSGMHSTSLTRSLLLTHAPLAFHVTVWRMTYVTP